MHWPLWLLSPESNWKREEIHFSRGLQRKSQVVTQSTTLFHTSARITIFLRPRRAIQLRRRNKDISGPSLLRQMIHQETTSCLISASIQTLLTPSRILMIRSPSMVSGTCHLRNGSPRSIPIQRITSKSNLSPIQSALQPVAFNIFT